MATGITDILKLENDQIRIEIAPAIGGRITSIYNKELNKEFLWHNKSFGLKQNKPGDDYDTNFWGGIDELLPNDIPEIIDGVSYPDHGELWCMPLEHTVSDNSIAVYGLLPLSGLFYRREAVLSQTKPAIELTYKIINQSGVQRHFLWKLHAALQIAKGDRLMSAAQKAKIVSQKVSRFVDTGEFLWPQIQGEDASVVPEKNNSMDFFYLYDSPTGQMSLLSEGGQHRFACTYNQEVFPYQWYFASYGQFRNHYTAILEPASAMPVSVNEAATLGQCTVLEPGEEINTSVTIYAGSAV